ncbi:hypothetical protein PIB30_044161 [Stylosanthes scabra]|uniref:Uncharacterized protein n=1 Tax=Stylosanthes scabra TaxID=79078 RepID=A0ABU6WHR5_9FABA|nr:hypothetical protein [Stylosanthes scabra]
MMLLHYSAPTTPLKPPSSPYSHSTSSPAALITYSFLFCHAGDVLTFTKHHDLHRFSPTTPVTPPPFLCCQAEPCHHLPRHRGEHLSSSSLLRLHNSSSVALVLLHSVTSVSPRPATKN